MATTLYLLDGSSGRKTAHLGTNLANLRGTNLPWNTFALDTNRGAGVSAQGSSTVAGTTPGVEIDVIANEPIQWISDPVSADVTISGTITANLWASENNMSANVAINVVIDIIRATDNSIVEIVRSTRVTEVAVTTRAVNNFTTGMTSGAYTAQTLNRGDRLRIRVFGDDAGTMGSGFTFDLGFNGTTAAVDGDSFVTFTETFSFENDPAGTTLYLTNVQSGLAGAPALISDFTGADENPLSEGGNWAILNSSGNPLQRISNSIAGTGTFTCMSYWTPANFGPDLEAYFTIGVYSSGNQGIALRIQGEGGAATWDGYIARTSGASSVVIAVVTNAVETAIITASVATWAAGDKFGVRIEGSTIQIWRQASGSSDWNLLATAVDATYGSAGKIAVRAGNTTDRLDDFYAATDSNLFTQKAWTSRGAGVVSYLSATNAGWVAPLYTQDWYTPQLQAFTLTGMAQANLRLRESNIAANASCKCEIARVDSDGSNPTVWASWCIHPKNTSNGELDGSAETAETAWVSGDDLSVSNGQRLRIRLYVDDSGSAALVTGHTVTFFYNGTSAAASGDSYVILAQSVSEFSSVPASLPYRPPPAVRRL